MVLLLLPHTNGMLLHLYWYQFITIRHITTTSYPVAFFLLPLRYSVIIPIPCVNHVNISIKGTFYALQYIQLSHSQFSLTHVCNTVWGFP